MRARGRSGRARRILMIIENVPLARDHRARKQVGTLLAAGYFVSVICPRDPGNAAFRDLTGLRMYEYRPPSNSSGRLAFIWEYAYSWMAAAALTIRAFADSGFDAIQAGHPPDIYSFLSLPFKLMGRPFIVDQRDLSPELFVTRYGRDSGTFYRLVCALERWSWRLADHVVCVNEMLQAAIERRGGLGQDRVTVVRNGPVLARTASRSPRPELKAGKRFLVCWIGLMGPQDQVDLALEAVRYVIQTLGRRDCLFTFIGDGELLDSMRTTARRLEIEEWVRFTGWLEESACFDHLATADLGIDPNLQEEVSPVKGMEYMAFGLPLVAFDLPQTRAMADDGAAYVPAGDVDAFARTIDGLLDDPERRDAIGAAGRLRIVEELAWDRQEEAYLGVFSRLLSREGGATHSEKRWEPEPSDAGIGSATSAGC
jgi:glycosyltransferase involved in cell wall biosynthesis